MNAQSWPSAAEAGDERKAHGKGVHAQIAPFRVVDPRQTKNWDKLVLAHPDATFFHSNAWCSVLCDSYGYRPLYLASFDEARLWAALPLLEVNSWLTGRRGICLPFTDECPPLSCRDIAFEDLFAQGLEQARSRRWKYIEIRGVSESNSMTASIRFYKHFLKLESDPESLFSAFDPGVRRAIRKAEKSGLSIEISSSSEAVAEYYRLHCMTRRGHGSPPQPRSFFRSISTEVIEKGYGFVVLAKHGAKSIAGAIYFAFGSRAIYKFGASDPEFHEVRPNNLLMWEAIQHLCRRGFEKLEFGRTSLSNAGLRRYKLGWGATETSCAYVKFDVRAGKSVSQKDNASGLHTRIFQILPGKVNQALGSILYRHIA